MDVISYSAARKTMVETMERVCDSHEPVVVTRRGGRPVVMVSLDDYNAMQETGYLLSTPANAARLRESIRQYEEGKAQERDLLDE